MLYVSLGPWKPDYFYAIGGMVLNFVGSALFGLIFFYLFFMLVMNLGASS